MPLPIWKGTGTTSSTLVQTPESGTSNLAERVTFTLVLSGKYAACESFGYAHPRGTAYTIGSVNYIVDGTVVRSQRGGAGVVEMTLCRLDTPPPDKFSCTPIEVNPGIEKNPYFAALNKDDIACAKTYVDAATPEARRQAVEAWMVKPNWELITDLADKWVKGEETFYQAGLKFTLTQFSFTPPSATLGGYIEAPSGTGSSLLPAGLSWLRQCDELVWDNGMYTLTKTWIGGPSGMWDSDLYS